MLEPLNVDVPYSTSAVLCLGEYRPYRHYRPRDRFSFMVRQFKRGAPDAIDYFLSKLQTVLPSGWAIAVVPPHHTGPNDSVIANLARLLANSHERTDATSVLTRIATIPKLSFGGSRTEQTHFESIQVENTHLISNRNLILLDDVVTTGCSLRVCKTLLLACDAKAVLPVALGKTVLHDAL